ncbi:aa3-type cytochrome oxidase subunit CtaJ [Modestobacter versicolor]|uniref:Uncharacterized protein n=1 Tax=Modestobacter versicolor TaxID=429133 RepID=A0A323VDV1_9ACTN|nr:hypothetical protein [Modestobacter versicolor]MBB3675978.1 hypothetical protein [Modestobacter versicolor]PZA22380.1 hypothetical protein DMO24_05420 [Modestobacter versicolor]
MPVIETVLIYGVIPLAVFLLLALATLIPGRGQQKTRYRPGQPWTAAPVWWEPHPDTSAGAAHGSDHGDAHADGHHGPSLGPTTAALAIGQGPHVPEPARRTAAGGARGTW